MSLDKETWAEFDGTVVKGHRVASGSNGDPRFPGGTIRMQTPFFRERGLELGGFFAGTLNVSVAPMRFRISKPRVTFRSVKWHPTEPAEDFSFFDLHLIRQDKPAVQGLIYYPHPDTKPQHFQSADVLELLLPLIEDAAVGTRLRLAVLPEQMVVGK